MRIRHLIAAADVEADGSILAPEQARHGVVVGGRIAALAGPIDPLTHLNLDFPDHRLDTCLVAHSLTVGAALLSDADGWRIAHTPPVAYAHRGPVDVGARRIAWQERATSAHGNRAEQRTEPKERTAAEQTHEAA